MQNRKQPFKRYGGNQSEIRSQRECGLRNAAGSDLSEYSADDQPEMQSG